MFLSLSHIYFTKSQCMTLVNNDLVKPFRIALVAFELFPASFFPSFSVGGVVGALYPSTIDH
jgi:hypothetical protein